MCHRDRTRHYNADLVRFFVQNTDDMQGQGLPLLLTLCGCMGMPLKSVTILLAEVMWTGRMPVLKPPI